MSSSSKRHQNRSTDTVLLKTDPDSEISRHELSQRGPLSFGISHLIQCLADWGESRRLPRPINTMKKCKKKFQYFF